MWSCDSHVELCHVQPPLPHNLVWVPTPHYLVWVATSLPGLGGHLITWSGWPHLMHTWSGWPHPITWSGWPPHYLVWVATPHAYLVWVATPHYLVWVPTPHYLVWVPTPHYLVWVATSLPGLGGHTSCIPGLGWPHLIGWPGCHGPVLPQ